MSQIDKSGLPEGSLGMKDEPRRNSNYSSKPLNLRNGVMKTDDVRVCVAFMLALAGGADASTFKEQLESKREIRLARVAKRARARQLREVKAEAKPIADLLSALHRTQNSDPNEVDTSSIAPEIVVGVMDAIKRAFRDVNFSAKGGTPGLPIRRLLEGLDMESYSGRVIKQAINMAERRLKPPPKASRRKVLRKKPELQQLLVPKNPDEEHHKEIKERVRSLKIRVLGARRGNRVEAKFPREFVLAAGEWIERLHTHFPSLAREFEGLAEAFWAIGLPNALNHRESLEQNFFAVQLMPPDSIQDLFADKVEWREVDQ